MIYNLIKLFYQLDFHKNYNCKRVPISKIYMFRYINKNHYTILDLINKNASSIRCVSVCLFFYYYLLISIVYSAKIINVNFLKFSNNQK